MPGVPAILDAIRERPDDRRRGAVAGAGALAVGQRPVRRGGRRPGLLACLGGQRGRAVGATGRDAYRSRRPELSASGGSAVYRDTIAERPESAPGRQHFGLPRSTCAINPVWPSAASRPASAATAEHDHLPTR
jgi:hypothetical protein